MSAREDQLVEEPYPAQPLLSGDVVYLAGTGAANRAAVDLLVFSARTDDELAHTSEPPPGAEADERLACPAEEQRWPG